MFKGLWNRYVGQPTSSEMCSPTYTPESPTDPLNARSPPECIPSSTTLTPGRADSPSNIASPVESRHPCPVTKKYRDYYTKEEIEKMQQRGFVGAIDQGTTSTRFIIFSVESSDPIVSAQLEITNIHPHSGWHEHCPFQLISSVEDCMDAAGDLFIELGFHINDVKTIGITNQRETTILWDLYTGKPVYNAIVWTDMRTTRTVKDMASLPMANVVPDLTGLPWSNYPSLVKLVWLMKNVPTAERMYRAGTLAFGTVDTWLIYWLNGGPVGDPVHVTDTTNASRTMMMNLTNLHWEDSIIGMFGMDREKMHFPKIVASSDPRAFGSIRRGLFKGIRITGCLGDQSAALVGQCAFEPGEAKNTYGTGCFMLYNAGSERPDRSYVASGLLATVAYDLHPGGEIRLPTYALEGSIAAAGSAVKFLINNLELAKNPDKINELAESVPDNGGVVFVTAFSGLLAPYWIDDARGTMFGITHYTQKGHLARATLEATCYQTKAIFEAMEAKSDTSLTSIAVDGGLSNSDICMQTQADVLGIPVVRPAMTETTALGAAYAAGLAAKCWSSTEELVAIKAAKQGTRTFMPDPSNKERTNQHFEKWTQAVNMCKGWVDPEEASKSGEAEDGGSSSPPL